MRQFLNYQYNKARRELALSNLNEELNTLFSKNTTKAEQHSENVNQGRRGFYYNSISNKYQHIKVVNIITTYYYRKVVSVITVIIY